MTPNENSNTIKIIDKDKREDLSETDIDVSKRKQNKTKGETKSKMQEIKDKAKTHKISKKEPYRINNEITNNNSQSYYVRSDERESVENYYYKKDKNRGKMKTGIEDVKGNENVCSKKNTHYRNSREKKDIDDIKVKIEKEHYDPENIGSKLKDLCVDGLVEHKSDQDFDLEHEKKLNKDCFSSDETKKMRDKKDETNEKGFEDKEEEQSKLDSKRSNVLKNLLGKLQKTQDKLKIKLIDKLKGELQRTSDVARMEGVDWTNLNLSERLVNLLVENKFDYPSPVQVHTIPKALTGDDLLVRAKNGTGKTLSYVIPTIELLTQIKDKGTEDSKNFALVIVPTRELAMQVGKVYRRIGIYCKEAIMSTFGGSNYYEDILRIEKGVGIIVGTPGRLFDLIEKNVIKLQKFRMLIIDEADQILAKEFTENIETTVYKFNKNRIMPNMEIDCKNACNIRKQMLLISATFPIEIFDFVKKFMNNAKEVNLMPELHLKGLKQFYTKVEEENKLHCLKTILSQLNYQKLIIFCNTVACTEKLGLRVLGMQIECYYFHSKMSAIERKNIFHKFTTSNIEKSILVTTDLLTRGIDVPEVNVVINFHLPKAVPSFLHRIGRAGRFGTTGCVISLCNNEEIVDLSTFEQYMGIQVKPVGDPSYKDYLI